MASQLWTSETTGYRRRGTKLAELLSVLGGANVTRTIVEPLLCAPEDQLAKKTAQILNKLGFDVAGVQKDMSGPVIGMVDTGNLISGCVGDHVKPIAASDLIDDDTPVADVLTLLRSKGHVFVGSKRHIRGIVTRADLNKPPIRVYLFGLISLMEMHLQFWVAAKYKGDSWLQHLSARRLDLARTLHSERQRADPSVTLLDCLQFCDKATLVTKTTDLIDELGLAPKADAKCLFASAQGLRNDLAHSQLNLARGTSWEDLLETVYRIEQVVHRSDQVIEKNADPIRDTYSNGLWYAPQA